MLTDDDLDNLRDLAKRQNANHAERKILAAVAEIVRLNDLLRLALASSQRSRDELHARDQEIERLRFSLGAIATWAGADNQTAYEMRKIAREVLRK